MNDEEPLTTEESRNAMMAVVGGILVSLLIGAILWISARELVHGMWYLLHRA